MVLVATAGSEQLAVAAFRAGAADYLSWPVPRPELERVWDRLVAPPSYIHDPFFLGQSEAIRRARGLIYRFAATPASVLITGETGTGKELAAKWLHRSSARAAAPFVSVSCARFPTPCSSELFGDERAARPGATGTPPGRLQAADGGTVFLDQVGELGLQRSPSCSGSWSTGRSCRRSALPAVEICADHRDQRRPRRARPPRAASGPISTTA